MQALAVRLAVVTIGLAAPAAVFAQPVERARDLEAFSSLEVRGCFDVKLSPGASPRLVVSATAEQHEKVEIEQHGGTVTIGQVSGAWGGLGGLCGLGGGNRVLVNVTARFAKDAPFAVEVHGSGDVEAHVPEASRLSAAVAGSGDLLLEASADTCEISIAGSGDVTARALECATRAEVGVHGSGDAVLEGKTRSCAYDIHGSGDINASGFACESAEVEISGSGSVDLAAIADLAVEIRGSGDVTYRGEPKLKRMDVHGSGGVRGL
jgi:hypothetical protein